jgi:hypothetical protein
MASGREHGQDIHTTPNATTPGAGAEGVVRTESMDPSNVRDGSGKI